MSKDGRYSESHRVSGETVVEQVVNGALGTSNAYHNSHSVDVRDNATGQSGHGHGTSHGEARDSAYGDLGQK